MWNFFIPLILLAFAYCKILIVVRRQAKVATERRKITAAFKEPVAGSSKGKTEQETADTGSIPDQSRRDKLVCKKAMHVGDQKQGLSAAKMNVIRTMIYIFICFIVCWMPVNVAMLYTRITVRSTG